MAPTQLRRRLFEMSWFVWLLRVCLVAVTLYSGIALAFYGWYAAFPGPNQESARIVVGIWCLVGLACIGALLASFFRRQPPSATPPVT